MKILRFLKRQSKALHMFLLMLLAAPMYVSAQETLTIYPDATGTSSYVPIPGNSVARFMKSEFVIPASQLEAMEGGTISQMTFHLSQTGSINGSFNFQVFLKEVNATSINSYYGPEGATIVYEGPLDGSQSTMDIAFTTNYTYHGGNLLVGVYQIANTYFVANIQFWGQTVSGASVQGTGSSLGNVSCNQRNFIPKTTFTYTAGNNTCPMPKNLAISNVTNNSATLSWTQTGNADHWDVFYTDNPNYEPKSYTHPQFANIDTNPFSLTELDAGRMYYFYVRGNCGDEVGDWSSPCVFLAADQITLNDGTTTNQYVPLAGEYVANNNTYGLFILPATDLQAITNAEIRQLTFYTSSPENISWGELTYDIILQESELTELTTSTNFNNVERSYRGRINVIGNKATLTLDEPYVYGGGNLVVYYITYKPGIVTNGRAYWLGVTTQNTSGYGSSWYRYYSSSGSNSNIEHIQSFLPKTTISYVFPDCIKPTDLEVSSTTTTSATLSWTALDSGQTEWEIQYRKYDEADYTAVEGTITNPNTIQGLEPSHNYVARVRAVCGNDSYSDWVETTFSTNCAPITLPYSYGFEDVDQYEFPVCWSYLVSGSAPNPLIWSGAIWSHASNRCLTMYCNDTEGSVTTILPEIPVDAEHPMNGNELVFYAVAYSGYAICQVGVMTDPTDPASFELVKEIEVIEGLYSSGNYHRFRVSFANYTGSGTFIAIRKVREVADYAERLLIDDIEVRPIPDCQEPINLTVTAVTSSTASLQWTAGGEESSWQVQYKLSDGEWPETYQTFGPNPRILEGLTSGTDYQVRVRAACYADEISDWTEPVSFTTAYIAPFFDDFDEKVYGYGGQYLPGWQWSVAVLDEVQAGTAQVVLSSIDDYWYSRDNVFTSGINGMSYFTNWVFYRDPDYDPTYSWMVTPNIELSEGWQFSFDLSLFPITGTPWGTDDDRFAVLVTNDNGATWTTLALWDNAGSELVYNDISTIPTEVNFDLSAYNNQTVRLAFYLESTEPNSGGTASNNSIVIDNINVTKCIKPDLVVASNITSNSASIDWTSHGETMWTLQYRIDGNDDWTTVDNIMAHPYTIGLVGPNSYQMRVKAHNATSDSEWSNIAMFATACTPISLGPDEIYEQTFEGKIDPGCWSADPFTVNSSNNGGWRIRTSYYLDLLDNIINQCAYAVCNRGTINANLVMPEIEVTPGLCITFHHSKNIKTSARIEAFVTLPWLENVLLWSTETDDLSAGVTTLSLNDYVGQTVTFTFNFYATNSGEFIIDNVTLRNLNTFTKQTEDGYWDETANWSKSVLPQAGQSVLINGEAVIPNGCIAQADEIRFTSNGTLTIADGGQLKHNNEGVTATVQKSIVPYTIVETNGEDKANGWYLIASPMAEAIEPTESMFANNIDLYRFNQSVELEWENYYQYFYLSPYFKLFNGNGYLYANGGDGTNDALTVEINGQLQPGNEELSFPLIYDASADFSGWNLVGNPYAHNVTAYTTTSVEAGCFRMNETHDDLMVSEVSAADPLQPMEGFFVKAIGTDASITFNASRRGATNWGEGSIYVDVLQDGMTIDRLIVKDNERSSLEKFSLNQNRTKIFAIRDHRETSIVSREGNEQAISFKAEKDGTYAFKVNVENMDLAYLHLIDNLTGNDVDLLALRQAQGPAEYTFEAKTSDYASRFRLVFISNETDGPSTGSGAFAFVNNGDIIILGDVEGATLQVIDVMGRVIACRDAVHTVSTAEMTPGVYVLRLIKGDSVKTQKIVVDR